MSAIIMINSRVPTERAQHIDIQHFAMQDWAHAKEIDMQHIPGILSIPHRLTKPLRWVLYSGCKDFPFLTFICQSYFVEEI